MFEYDRLATFVDGFVTNKRGLTDEMYANSALHEEGVQYRIYSPYYPNSGTSYQVPLFFRPIRFGLSIVPG